MSEELFRTRKLPCLPDEIKWVLTSNEEHHLVCIRDWDLFEYNLTNCSNRYFYFIYVDCEEEEFMITFPEDIGHELIIIER